MSHGWRVKINRQGFPRRVWILVALTVSAGLLLTAIWAWQLASAMASL